MNPSDYRDAYALIRSWNDDSLREAQLQALKGSDRRAYVMVAMILIAALLSKITVVSEGFVEQLTNVNDSNLAEGVLHITDQILRAVDADDTPDTQGAEELLDTIPDIFAFRDIVGYHDAEG